MENEFNFGYESIIYYLKKVNLYPFLKNTEEVLPNDEHNGGILIDHNEFFIAIYLNKLSHFEISICINDDLQAFSIIDSGDILESFLFNVSLELIDIF